MIRHQETHFAHKQMVANGAGSTNKSYTSVKSPNKRKWNLVDAVGGAQIAN